MRNVNLRLNNYLDEITFCLVPIKIERNIIIAWDFIDKSQLFTFQYVKLCVFLEPSALLDLPQLNWFILFSVTELSLSLKVILKVMSFNNF